MSYHFRYIHPKRHLVWADWLAIYLFLVLTVPLSMLAVMNAPADRIVIDILEVVRWAFTITIPLWIVLRILRSAFRSLR